MGRPPGVTMLGVLALGEAAWIGISLLLHGQYLNVTISQAHGTGILFGAVAIGLFAWTGFGLLGLKPWALILARGLSALYILIPVREIWFGARGFTQFGTIFFYADNIIALAITGWALWYLSKPKVRSAFDRSWANISALR
jgi:hypothetical protein